MNHSQFSAYVDTLFAVNDIFDFFLYAGTLPYTYFPFTQSFPRKRESMGFRLLEFTHCGITACCGQCLDSRFRGNDEAVG
ncbi:hypothetical protein SAMN05216420_104117 [Nitrosospira sp. Nl5]|nr:hypothetical protein SAMN05216420_104117 [Nitrosospira sp. Nl5]